jgi:uncharacterized membrane protein YvlD (DUF360 family)
MRCLHGVRADAAGAPLWAAAWLGLINAVVRPVVVILTSHACANTSH